MPIVRIDIAEGRELENLILIKDLVMNAVAEVLQLPDDDRNVLVNEYRNELFNLKLPYKILIEITLFSGRTIETKKKLYQQIVNELEKSNLCAKEEVFIVLNEQPLQNWGVRGGISADEINLNFKIDI